LLRFGPIDSAGSDDTLRVPPLRALISAESPANSALREVERVVPTDTLPTGAALAAVSETAPRSSSEVGTDQLLALLYRQLRCLAGPRPDLDDIVQAAAVRVLKALPRFEGRAQLSTWTYGVAYRTLLDHDRWHARFRRRYTCTDDEKLPEPRSRFDSESLLIEVERARRLYQALDQLPPAKRAVLILHDLEGLPAGEVAAVVGVSEATVRSRLRDGRAKLVQLLERDPLFRPGAAQ
jgi:RNA polymerase sigma-70 factor (ECF subfamily)